jgi:hypothetical protein
MSDYLRKKSSEPYITKALMYMPPYRDGTSQSQTVTNNAKKIDDAARQ